MEQCIVSWDDINSTLLTPDQFLADERENGFAWTAKKGET